MHSEDEVSSRSVHEFAAKVQAPVDEHWLEGVRQFDFYAQPDPMQTAADLASKHFTRILNT